MKTSNKCSALILVAMFCAFATASSIKAQEIIVNSAATKSSGPARLVVNRSADFGVDQSINLVIDGKASAVLAYNERYDAVLSAGKHVLSITTDPTTYSAQPIRSLTIAAQPGKTYTFTAVWRNPEQAGLVAN
jgi:hypothetical protein